jgi:flagellar motility protein MotE (MotC chaperone)
MRRLTRFYLLRFALVAATSALTLTSACAQDGVKPKASPNETEDIARYCAALGPSIVEARAAYQLRRLEELEAQTREEVEKLEAKEQEAREWVLKREEMMKAATDDVVGIYSKMAADAAAAKLGEMDDRIAAAVLGKLKPGVAAAILAEMATDKAAKLSTLLAGALPADKS